MNRTVPSPSNWPDNEVRKRLAVKKSGIRAIDKGTCYDVPGKLRKLAREIEKGKHGEVRGAIVGVICVKQANLEVQHITVGHCAMAELHMLASFLEWKTGVQ